MENTRARFVNPLPAFVPPEEFVSVYRMHSLLPESIAMQSASIGEVTEPVGTVATRDEGARELMADVGLTDVAYTFGTEHPGALVLNNYPAVERLRWRQP
jgi:hypothetical protein